MRGKYGFAVPGYVVMPEHVHPLANEPTGCSLARVLQALKISMSVQRCERPFWQRRYCDFNVHSDRKITEKLRYLHRNPVARGLVEKPEDWQWSSFRITLPELRERSKSSRFGQRGSGRGGR